MSENVKLPGGIEIVSNESVPEGEIWILAPGPEGVKIQYAFTLGDHKLALRPPGRVSFLDSMSALLRELEDRLLEGDVESAKFGCEIIQTHIRDFKAGKEPPYDEKTGLPSWMTTT